MIEEIFRVVDRNGEPVNYRNNDRKNLYRTRAHAQSAATQFNDVEVWDSKVMRSRQLEGAPYTVQVGKLEWV